VQRHRQRLSDAQQAVFQRHLGERLQALGYHRPRDPQADMGAPMPDAAFGPRYQWHCAGSES